MGTILLLHSKGAKGNIYRAKLDKLLNAEKARKIEEEKKRRFKEEQERLKKEEERRKKYLYACQTGDFDYIKTPRQYDGQYNDGMTRYKGLMLAVQNQHKEVVKYLLDNGGDVGLSLN